MTILHFAISAGLAYPVLSLMEYVIHRHLMHKNAPAKFLQNNYLADTFRNHAIIHHGRCYAIFDEEKSSCAEIDIRVKPLTMLVVMAPSCLSIFFLDPIASLLLFAGGIINGTLWSEIHDEMHRPKGAWFCNLRAYRYLKRRHYLLCGIGCSERRRLRPTTIVWKWIRQHGVCGQHRDRIALRKCIRKIPET
jgi:hypothetical protein